MEKLIILVGPPAAGKSSLASQLSLSAGCKLIDMDDVGPKLYEELGRSKHQFDQDVRNYGVFFAMQSLAPTAFLALNHLLQKHSGESVIISTSGVVALTPPNQWNSVFGPNKLKDVDVLSLFPNRSGRKSAIVIHERLAKRRSDTLKKLTVDELQLWCSQASKLGGCEPIFANSKLTSHYREA